MKVPEDYFSNFSETVMAKIDKTGELKIEKKNKRSLFFTLGGVAAAALIALTFLLPTSYNPFQVKEATAYPNNDYTLNSSEYYLFLQDMAEDSIEEEYWMTMN